MASTSGYEPDYVVAPRSKRAVRQRKCINIERENTSPACDAECIKISKTAFPSVQKPKKIDSNDLLYPKRTSTPEAKVAYRRLSQVFQELKLSPVVLIDEKKTYKKSKLGNPLLSSTKLYPNMDNDRLSNAVRLYQSRVGVKLTAKEAELVTSQLLHKNAMVNTFTLDPDDNK